ncbi:unnamed protein product [Symbiodinium sp. KB8]|nr:unnamed protein product [Symbiodinium sp. KB8]
MCFPTSPPVLLRREVAKHKIPFADEPRTYWRFFWFWLVFLRIELVLSKRLDTPLSRSFARAFDQGAGTLMGKHLMDPDVRQDLINSYSAFSLSGATQLAWESVLAVVGFVALPLLVT